MRKWKKGREDTPFPTRSLTRFAKAEGRRLVKGLFYTRSLTSARRPRLAKIDTNRSVASLPLSFPEVGEYVTVASK